MLKPTLAKTRILVVDDDKEVREVVRVLLSSEDYEVVEADSGAEALKAFTHQVDLVILDVMMPGISGYQVCQAIRKVANVPILFLTAKTQSSDLVMGYSSGGDDYLAKPFSYPELLARVKGLLRRYKVYQGKNLSDRKSEFIEWRGIRLDCSGNMVWKDGNEINLTDTEYRILRLLISYPGQIFSIPNIYESIWDEPYLSASSNSVMVFIRKLRNKIEDDPKHPTYLVTVWGKGYRIC